MNLSNFTKACMVFTMILSVKNANAQVGLSWAKSFGGLTEDKATAIKVDALGNVLTCGYFSGTVDFDPGTGVHSVTCPGVYNSFVTKFDAIGNFQWLCPLIGSNRIFCSNMAIDSPGNTLILGSYWGTLSYTIGATPYTLTSTGVSSNIFLCKIDTAGNIMWLKRLDATVVNAPGAIILDNHHNIFITGHYTGTTDLDPGILYHAASTTLGNTNMFVSKLDTAGDLLWTKEFVGGSNAATYDVDLDTSGNIFVTGMITDTTDMDPGPSVHNLIPIVSGNHDFFITKLDNAGNFLWVKLVGSDMYDIAVSSCVDAGGNIYTTGYFMDTTDMDPGPAVHNFYSHGNADAFVLKLDPSGNYAWAIQIGDTATDNGYMVLPDVSGNVYTIGIFSGTVDFDPGAGVYNLTAAGSVDIYLSKYDASGNFLWARRWGGNQDDEAPCFTADVYGSLYVAGHFFDTADVDPGTGTFNLISNGNSDIFVEKLTSTTTGFGPGVLSPASVVYPNPVKETLYIQASDNGIYTLTDMTGRALQHGLLQAGQNELSTQGLAAGMYILQMQKENGERTCAKIIKQ